MKEFVIEVGGRRRKLRFTSSDGRELYRRHRKPLSDLIWTDILGFGKRPDGTFDPKNQSEWNPVAQFDLLFLGLKNEWPGLTEEELDAHMTRALLAENGNPEAHPQQWIGIAAKAAMFQGIVYGRSVDFDAFVEEKAKDIAQPETSQGNAQEPARN